MDRPWYVVLDLSPTADAVTVKKKYRELSKIYHPDSNLDGSTDDLFKEVVKAYDEYENLTTSIMTTSKFTVQKCPPINIKVGSDLTNVTVKILTDITSVCSDCGGSGKIILRTIKRGSIEQNVTDMCSKCRGKGTITVPKVVEETVTVDTRKSATLFGLGNKDLIGYTRGDIIIS